MMLTQNKFKTAGESYANFFDLETDFKLEEVGRYNLAPSKIFPKISRDVLTADQQSTLDQILHHMRCTWSKKFKIKVRTGNSSIKKKRPRTEDPSKSSLPHKNVKAEETS